VSAGQSVPVQFAQSLGQAFLGINLKCASCHDSFIDRWKLEEAYGLAAIYAETPLEIYRCDKPLGKTARPHWLFPELGEVEAGQPRAERLRQLAALMTHPENGRLTRTVVNRLWQRLMGRGLVHPTDAMQTEPWSADLLDYLATHLADHGYDLKQTLELICTAQAYQSKTQVVDQETDDSGYVYAGPRAKRLTAEQFVDALSQITDTAPARPDAQVPRGKADPAETARLELSAGWIWSRDGGGTNLPKAGATIALRKRFVLTTPPTRAGAAITCDNSYRLYVNGRMAGANDAWEDVEPVALEGYLHQGTNQVLVVAGNAGAEPNPAGLFFEARLRFADGSEQRIVSDPSWEWVVKLPDGQGRYGQEPTDWQPAVVIANPGVWTTRLGDTPRAALAQAFLVPRLMVRASLMKSDPLLRALGRPNREQIVSMRPSDLTTLEAIDLNNGQILATRLEQGGRNLASRRWGSNEEFARWLFSFALSRAPTAQEVALAAEAVGGARPSPQGIQDLVWAVCMLPEFQLVR
jgi:hypothetical protein